MNASDFFAQGAGQLCKVSSKIILKIAGIKKPGYFLITRRKMSPAPDAWASCKLCLRPASLKCSSS